MRETFQTHHFGRKTYQLFQQPIYYEILISNAGKIDGIIGGPPCQGFSHMGQNDSEDPRNQLFIHFFQIVSEAVPKFFLAENVPGILSQKNDHFVEQALSKVRRIVTKS